MTRAQYDEYLFLQMQRMDERTAEEERQKNIAELEQAQQAAVQAQERLKTTALNLLQTGRFSLEEVADLTGSTPEQLRQWQQA